MLCATLIARDKQLIRNKVRKYGYGPTGEDIAVVEGGARAVSADCSDAAMFCIETPVWRHDYVSGGELDSAGVKDARGTLHPVNWTPKCDLAVLRGVLRHGWSRWADVATDPELALLSPAQTVVMPKVMDKILRSTPPEILDDQSRLAHLIANNSHAAAKTWVSHRFKKLERCLDTEHVLEFQNADAQRRRNAKGKAIQVQLQEMEKAHTRAKEASAAQQRRIEQQQQQFAAKRKADQLTKIMSVIGDAERRRDDARARFCKQYGEITAFIGNAQLTPDALGGGDGVYSGMTDGLVKLQSMINSAETQLAQARQSEILFDSVRLDDAIAWREQVRQHQRQQQRGEGEPTDTTSTSAASHVRVPDEDTVPMPVDLTAE